MGGGDQERPKSMGVQRRSQVEWVGVSDVSFLVPVVALLAGPVCALWYGNLWIKQRIDISITHQYSKCTTTSLVQCCNPWE